MAITAHKTRTTLTIEQSTWDWLKAQAPNSHSIGTVVDNLVSRERTGRKPDLVTIVDQLERIEQLVARAP